MKHNRRREQQKQLQKETEKCAFVAQKQQSHLHLHFPFLSKGLLLERLLEQNSSALKCAMWSSKRLLKP